MTKERVSIVESMVFTTRVMKLQLSCETFVEAVVRLSEEFNIKPEEVEEVLAKEEGKGVEGKKQAA